jgi:hypothetical protein
MDCRVKPGNDERRRPFAGDDTGKICARRPNLNVQFSEHSSRSGQTPVRRLCQTQQEEMPWNAGTF